MDQKKIDREMEEIDAVQLSPEEEARIDEALRNAKDPCDDEVALSAEYDSKLDLLLVQLKSGQRLSIPRSHLQDLVGITPAEAANIHIDMLGMCLRWPDLDIDLLVDDLRQGIYGSTRWMTALDSGSETAGLSQLHHAVL